MEDPMNVAAGDAASAGSDGAALRGATRVTLMFRVAKLVSEDVELPCIVRDVSATGVRLRLFRPLEARRRLALELANGDFYFIEKVWEKGGEAGFRFSGEVDVQAFTTASAPHGRKQVRLRTSTAATLSARGESHAVVLRDLSQGGARIEAGTMLRFAQPLRIDAPGLTAIEARVRWCAHPHYGIAFERSFRLDEFTHTAAELPRPARLDGQAFRAQNAILAGGNAPLAQFG